jgi:hypothetical protein
VPVEQQQRAALHTNLGLDLGEDELEEVAARIRGTMAETGKEEPGA